LVAGVDSGGYDLVFARMKKLIVGLIILGAVGFLAYRLGPGWRTALGGTEEQPRLKTAAVIQTNINFAVNAAGEIGPAEQVSVRPEINGRLEELPVDIGDRVRQGELLFKLDDKELQQQRASNLTAINRAKLELEKAERDYLRALDLLAGNLISQELFDNTKTTYELAKNSLDRTQNELALIDERLTKTEVRAPFDCTVLLRPISVGQAVSGSGGFNSGTEVLSIADLNYLIINAHINQADVPRLQPNQTVEVGVEAVAGLKVTGVVERIAPQANIRNNIKGFAARIRIENPDERIRPGMTANIKIPVASAENVVAVPLVAVFTEKPSPTSTERERYVYVARGNTFERRLVKVGVSDFFFAEIQEGLSAGDVVALELPKDELKQSPPPEAAAAPAPRSPRLAASNTPTPVTNSMAATPAGIPTASGSASNVPAASVPTTANAASTPAAGTPEGSPPAGERPASVSSERRGSG
jgi:HlyD family secretion protein